MKKIQVKEIMVPVSEYAIVYEDASLYEALLVLEKSKILFQQMSDVFDEVCSIMKSELNTGSE